MTAAERNCRQQYENQKYKYCTHTRTRAERKKVVVPSATPQKRDRVFTQESDNREIELLSNEENEEEKILKKKTATTMH